MSVRSDRWSGAGRALLVSAAVLAGGAGCLDRPAAPVPPKLQSGVSLEVVNNAVDKVDLLFMVDNSNSMKDNQSQLVGQFNVLIRKLVAPDTDCNGDMRPDFPPVRDMHVGVVDSDLGTPGSTVPSCQQSDVGDDGLLNPIRYGAAEQRHNPVMVAPPGFRPADCNRIDQFPKFLSWDSMATPAMCAARDSSCFAHDFICNAALYINGCGLEQQMEAVYRALIVHDARERPGNTSPNAGFLRTEAILAIVVVTDEEDGSVRDCRYAEPGDTTCPARDALGVFNSSDMNWASNDLNLRMYMYQQGSPQDPTWPIDRYIDLTRPTRGFLGLKPNHPDRVIFAGIVGMPIEVPFLPGFRATPMPPAPSTDPACDSQYDPSQIDYDRLLGRSPNGSDALDTMSREGPVSMRQANPDPNCSTRTVPACYREGTTWQRACDTTAQYYAWPSRRIIQVARRFQQGYQNGLVTSICRRDYGDAIRQIAKKIQGRLSGRCLPRRLLLSKNNVPAEASADYWTVDCQVRELLPMGMTTCATQYGHTLVGPDPTTRRTVCNIAQVPAFVDPGNASNPMNGTPLRGRSGFYYDTGADPTEPNCSQRISFTDNGRAGPAMGATIRLECVQAVSAPTSGDAGR